MYVLTPDGSRRSMRPVYDPLDGDLDNRGDPWETALAMVHDAVAYTGSHRIAEVEGGKQRWLLVRPPLPLSPALAAAVELVERVGAWELVELEGRSMISVSLPDGGQSFTAATDAELALFRDAING